MRALSGSAAGGRASFSAAARPTAPDLDVVSPRLADARRFPRQRAAMPPRFGKTSCVIRRRVRGGGGALAPMGPANGRAGLRRGGGLGDAWQARGWSRPGGRFRRAARLVRAGNQRIVGRISFRVTGNCTSACSVCNPHRPADIVQKKLPRLVSARETMPIGAQRRNLAPARDRDHPALAPDARQLQPPPRPGLPFAGSIAHARRRHLATLSVTHEFFPKRGIPRFEKSPGRRQPRLRLVSSVGPARGSRKTGPSACAPAAQGHA